MKRQKTLERIKITPEKEEKAREKLRENPVEKNDIKAFIIAAFLSFVLPTMILFGILGVIMWLIFFL